MVQYVPYDNHTTSDEMLSRQWATIVRVYNEQRRTHLEILEGHRTMERQRFFWNCGPNGCCCCNNCNTAAFPSDQAPHIKTGRPDHAVDIAIGQVQDFVNWASTRGLQPRRVVAGEPWHVELDRRKMHAFYERHADATKDFLEPLPAHVEKAAAMLISARKRVIQEQETGCGPQCLLWKSVRNGRRRKLEKMWRRSDNPRTKRILRVVLDDRNGVITPGEHDR